MLRPRIFSIRKPDGATPAEVWGNKYCSRSSRDLICTDLPQGSRPTEFGRANNSSQSRKRLRRLSSWELMSLSEFILLSLFRTVFILTSVSWLSWKVTLGVIHFAALYLKKSTYFRYEILFTKRYYFQTSFTSELAFVVYGSIFLCKSLLRVLVSIAKNIKFCYFVKQEYLTAGCGFSLFTSKYYDIMVKYILRIILKCAWIVCWFRLH